MNYNPYDLVPLLIDGKPIQGRVIALDSDVVNQKTMKNAFGAVVKPSKVMTMCPNCAQGLEVDLKLDDPPFQPVVHTCPYCKPAPPPVVDPFINPVKTGRVPPQELDPLLHDPNKPLLAGEGTVAERFAGTASLVPSVAPQVPAPAAKPPRPQSAKKAKKEAKKAAAAQKAPEAPKPRPVLVEQAIQPRPPEDDVANPGDPFTLTRTESSRPVGIEEVEGLKEEQDFDDKDMVE